MHIKALVRSKHFLKVTLPHTGRLAGRLSRLNVLIFPPVNNYRRFLIHKVSESLVGELGHRRELVTFSIGTGSERRTVVCHRHQLLRDVKATSSKSFEDSTDGASSQPQPQPQLSWRSSIAGPSSGGASASTVPTTSASAASHTNCSAAVASNNNCASGGASASTSGSKSKKRTKRDPAGLVASGGAGASVASDNSKMGVETQHQHEHFFSASSDCGSFRGE
ncbi:hypothetical protein pipiens_012611 [Culex pipiens pipiens]|uniref:R3H domain-containing protein n=2 Tax=Culex pipiens pipiens TaxID=38569 RepID=A0ABD1D1N7_CULPP